jgi:hypothetical protein
VGKIAIDKQWVKHISGFPTQLQQDEAFRRHCIIKGFHQRCYSKKIKTYCDCDYNELPEQWKADRAVITAAFKNQRATLTDIPESLLSDDNFLRQTARDHPQFFSQLPPKIQNDVQYWLSEGKLTERLVAEILGANPTLGEDRQFWVNLLKENQFEVEEYVEWIEEYAPQAIQLDHDIMFRVITKDPQRLFQEYHSLYNLPILRDESFMRRLFDSLDGFDITSVPEEFQRLYPHLVAGILIPNVLQNDPDEDEVEEFARSIAEDLWNNFDVVTAWFSNNGKFIEEVIPETWNLDPKTFLWIVEHCEEEDVAKCFERAPKAMLDDKSFMMQVIQLDPKLYQAASKRLQDDMELRMVVCSMVSSMDDLLVRCGMNQEDVQHTLEHAQERYQAVQGFETYRSCVSNSDVAAVGSSPITLLNQGPTTSVAYHSLIHAYVNVPTGNELQLVERCVENLTKL